MDAADISDILRIWSGRPGREAGAAWFTFRCRRIIQKATTAAPTRTISPPRTPPTIGPTFDFLCVVDVALLTKSGKPAGTG